MDIDRSFKLLDLEKGSAIEDADNAYKYLYQMINLIHDDEKDKKRLKKLKDLNAAYESVTSFMGIENALSDKSISCLKPDETDDINLQRQSIEDEPPSRVPDPESVNLEKSQWIKAEPDKKEFAPSIHPTDAKALEPPLQAKVRQVTEQSLIEAQQARGQAEKAKRDAENAKITAGQIKADAETAMHEAENALNRANARKNMAEDMLAEADKDLLTATQARVCAEEAFKKSRQIIKEAEQFKEKSKQVKKEADAARQQAAALMKKAQEYKIQAENKNADAWEKETGGNTAFEDLLEIEKALNTDESTASNRNPSKGFTNSEKRSDRRVSYKPENAPRLILGGKSFPIVDFCTKGVRVRHQGQGISAKIVRGAISFDEKPPIPVTGKVIRNHESETAVKLATRIPNMIVQQELQATGQA